MALVISVVFTPWLPSIRENYIVKKTTYALKKPHVVALPFIYGVESLLVTDDEDLQSAREATSLVFMPSYTLLGI